MSHLQQLVAYDQALLDQALTGEDAGRLIEEARPWSSPETKAAAASLLRLIEIRAPEVIIENTRFRADPRGFVIEQCRRGEVPERSRLIELARRTVLPLKTSPNTWQQARWVADAAARVVIEEHEYWPFITAAAGDAAVAAIFTGTPLDENRGIHRLEALEDVAAFFERLRKEAPPHLDEYRRWYRALHSHRFAVAMDDEERVPDDGALAWDYASFLSVIERDAVRVARFARLCRRRRWALVIEIG